MLLNILLDQTPHLFAYGNPHKEISQLCCDSRTVTPNALFVAKRGINADGHDFLPTCIQQGATAIVINNSWVKKQKEAEIQNFVEQDVTVIIVDDTNIALGQLAAAWYDNPSTKLKLVGITGTNGKTTIATLSFNLCRLLGEHAGLISTIENRIDNDIYPTEHTTPDAITIQSLLAKMVEKGCKYAFMEVSSHAIDQHRIEGLHFHIAAFTNLTRDHLDYHGTFEQYRDTKQSLFTQLDKNALAITNLDDKNGTYMTQKTKASVYTYSIHDNSATFHAQLIEMNITGMEMLLNQQHFYTPLVGLFNISNLLCIYAIANLLKLNNEQLLPKMSLLQPARGRFQHIRASNGKSAIIDYAHTPDAVLNVLKTIKQIIQHSPNRNGKIITVIGCGGNRDKGKRPLMAKIAFDNSQQLILTNDNPRFEDPNNILQDMLNGLNDTEQNLTLVIPDRENAIKTACSLANQNDIILIAGKGHENYQIINGIKHHFDDYETTMKYL